MSFYAQFNRTAVVSGGGGGREATWSRSSTTPRRSPSPALENGLTKLSLGHETQSKGGGGGAILKTPQMNGQKPRNAKIRHPTDPSSSGSKERGSPKNSVLVSYSNYSKEAEDEMKKKKKKKSLSFSDSHLMSRSSASMSSSSSSSPCKVHGNSTGSGSLSSAALTSSGRRIHVILPNSETPGEFGGGEGGGGGGATGADATPDDIITPDSLKSVTKGTSDNSGLKMTKGQLQQQQQQQQQRTPKKELKSFETYMKLDELQRGLKRGELLEGVLRINPKNYQDAYISVPGGPDIFLGGIHDRNRALNGDVVVVQLKPKQQWKILTSDLRTFLVRNYNTLPAADASLSPLSSSILTPRFQSKATKTKKQNEKTSAKEKDLLLPAENNENTDWATWNGHGDITSSTAERSSNCSGGVGVKKTRRKRGRGENKKGTDSVEVPTDVVEKLQNKGDNDSKKKKRNRRKRQNKKTVKSTESTSLIRSDCCHSVDLVTIDVPSVLVSDSGEVNVVMNDESIHFDDEKNEWGAKYVSNGVGSNDDGWNRAAKEAQVAIIQLEDLLVDNPNVLDISDEYDRDVANVIEDSGGVVPPDELSEFDDSISNASSCHDLHQDAAEDAAFFYTSVDPNDDVVFVGDVDDEILVDIEEIRVNDIQSVDGRREDEVSKKESSVKMLDDLYYPGSKKDIGLEPIVNNDVALLTRSILEKLSTKKLEELTVEDVLDLPNGSMFVQRSAKVVCIVERKNTCLARGYLKPMKEKDNACALFVPIDHRIPRMKIHLSTCPSDFTAQHKKYANVLFIARLTEWENDGLAIGQLCRSLSEGDLIENETEGILIENNVDCSEFSSQVLNDLPKELPWSIPQEELARRRDFRNTCVFTIDPATARDLDDAMSCDQLNDGLYHVAVHIADVSHFLKFGTALDGEASRRATSVYLVQKVVPMLPRLLCEKLCSLNPGEDRLAFSVEWIIREDGAVLEEWFGRTIIRSCAKLSYDDAQNLITVGSDAIPPMHSGWSADDIAERVLTLHKLAVLLRRKRGERGALRLDQAKIYFKIDETTGLPVDYNEYVIRDSNRLIEEFMLLANMAVSRKIYRAFPELAVLRRHPPPQEKGLREVVESCKGYGIFLDATSSQSLQESLTRLSTNNNELGMARVRVLTSLLSKPMNCAQYFCSGCMKDGATEDDFWHYALNVPFYTHFTSPIRRYPDVLVHRLLAAALNYDTVHCSDPKLIEKQLIHCNDMKMTAKRVGEMSTELFLAIYIKNIGHVEELGMVCRVLDHSFDVLVLKMGIIKRIFCEHLKLANYEYTEIGSVPKLRLVYPVSNGIDSTLPNLVNVVEILQFSLVSVILTTTNETPLKINAILKRPVL